MVLLQKRPPLWKDYLDVGYFPSEEAAILHIRASGDAYAFGPSNVYRGADGGVWLATPAAYYRIMSTDYCPQTDWSKSQNAYLGCRR